MCQTILQNPSFFKFLLRIDQDHAATIRLRGCIHCGGPLHQTHYERKPRDAPSSWIEEKIRFSFCCGHCRRRCTPASVRFLGRRVYWGATVLLVTALCHGLPLRRSNKLSQHFGGSHPDPPALASMVADRIHPDSRYGRPLRGRFLPPVEAHSLPGELLHRCSARTATKSTLLQDSMTQVMRWLAPLSTLTEDQ
ncbi:hypothetical protein [Ferrovum myxofaciens]|uniref:hypothetical protein n=1 Tax=Ferrovum myxofaciens TaxID=416213 RepID=UPI0023568C95|nr:hypothetical protein [Ferrovum myxofaciens]